jgi:hypothetical protein
MQAASAIPPEAARWRFQLGLGVFVLAFAIWLLVLLATAANFSATSIAALTGAVFVGNKILLLLCIAVMGRAGFYQLKRRALSYVAYLAPAPIVGPRRHAVGLIMFSLPLLSTFLQPYIDYLAPGLRPKRWELQVLGDLVLIASFFVLGGNFREKVRALFIRTAQVTDPAAS